MGAQVFGRALKEKKTNKARLRQLGFNTPWRSQRGIYCTWKFVGALVVVILTRLFWSLADKSQRC